MDIYIDVGYSLLHNRCLFLGIHSTGCSVVIAHLMILERVCVLSTGAHTHRDYWDREYTCTSVL